MNGLLYQCAWLGYRGNISLKPSWNLTIEQLSPRSGEEVVGTRVSHSSFTCDFRLVTSTLKTISQFLWCAHVTYIIAKHCSPRVWQDESSCEMYKNEKGSCKAWKLLLLTMQICDLPVLVVIVLSLIYFEKREYFLQFTRWEKKWKISRKRRCFYLCISELAKSRRTI